MNPMRPIHLESLEDLAELRATLRGWRDLSPASGVLLFVAEADVALVPRLQQLCAEERVPLVGGVFPALIVGGAFRTRGILILPLPRMPSWRLIDGISASRDSLRTTCDGLEQLVRTQGPGAEGGTLFLLFDVMASRIASLLAELYYRLGDEVRYAGANAGSETFRPMPCLFDGERLVGDAVLALVLRDHDAAILEHGYRTPPQLVAATATRGNRILSIDWRPAFEVYVELARAQYGLLVTKENFYSCGVHFPFGLLRADGEVLVRIPVALDEDGSLVCVGEVPENAVLTLLRAVDADSPGTVEALARRYAEAQHASEGTGLVWYCAGRKLHLGEAAQNELSALQARLRPVQLVGGVSLGEIGSTRAGGYPLFHNAAVSLLPWSPR